MKSIHCLFLFILGLTLVAAACKKGGDANIKKEIISSKSWKVTFYTINGKEVPLTDCQKDNYLTFNSNGTYTDFTGALKCSISETDINGTWTLSDDGEILTLISFQGIQYASIEITESKLALTIKDGTDIIIMTCIPY